MKVQHYFDYKSPYAYLAKAGISALADEMGFELELLPYTLDIPAYLGSASTDERGRVVDEMRNAHQWRRVKYSYMDCRREANRRGLTIRGPRKIFDSTIAHIGFLYIEDAAARSAYHDAVFEKFWRRELDIEDRQVVTAEIARAGCDPAGFSTYLDGPGRARLNTVQQDSEKSGVFGVPSYLVAGELFWGAERLERVRELVIR